MLFLHLSELLKTLDGTRLTLAPGMTAPIRRRETSVYRCDGMQDLQDDPQLRCLASLSKSLLNPHQLVRLETIRNDQSLLHG